MFIIRGIWNIVLYWVLLPLFTLYFAVLKGWRVEGRLPDLPKYIIAAAPHTSNMDTVILVWIATRWRVKQNWLGKQELFETPIIGQLSREMGGIPVDRDSPIKAMKQTIAAIKERDEVILGIAPDGTRQKTDHWKKGFYYIAHKTGLPIIFVRVDYGTNCVTIREPFQPSGDMAADLDIIRPFYDGVVAHKPENASAIRVPPKGATTTV